jgi:hypothetical protein
LSVSGAINNQVVITNNKTDGSVLAAIRFNNNVNNYGYIGIGGSNTSNYSSNLYLQADKNIVINTGGSNSNNINFIIDSNGNVGIATTNPASKLHVNGITTLNSNLIVTTGYVGIGTATIGATNSNFNVFGTSYFNSDVNINGKITQSGTGDISLIGTTILNSNLAVSGAIDNQVVITNNKTGGTGLAAIRFNNNVNNSGYIGVGGSNTSNYSSNLYLQADKNIVFNTGGNNSNAITMIINSNKSVSIGTTSIGNTGELICSSNIKENNAYLKDTYINVSLLPRIKKKSAFYCSLSTNITINGINLYKYDIDLTKYTQLATTNASNPYRIFNIRAFVSSAYFSYFTSDFPNVLQYDIYMSSISSPNSDTAFTGANGPIGINVCAIGSPENYNLSNLLPTAFSLLKTSNSNYISFVSSINSLGISCIIEDYLY